jgi:hypothetical protein
MPRHIISVQHADLDLLRVAIALGGGSVVGYSRAAGDRLTVIYRDADSSDPGCESESWPAVWEARSAG